MALSAVITDTTVFGDIRVIKGTYTKLTGDTTGTLTLGLNAVNYCNACSSTAAIAVGVSWATGTLTFYGAAGDTGGYWEVHGY
jgi:hypothetical protein